MFLFKTSGEDITMSFFKPQPLHVCFVRIPGNPSTISIISIFFVLCFELFQSYELRQISKVTKTGRMLSVMKMEMEMENIFAQPKILKKKLSEIVNKTEIHGRYPY